VVAIGVPSFFTITAPGPVVLAFEEGLHGLMALVAVGGEVLIARVVLLLSLALITSRT
jgi:hypothetical protein